MPRGVQLTRITIVEDHELFAEVLDLALTLQGHEVRRVGVPGGATTMAQVLTEVRRQRPQVVILDLDLGPAGDGSRLIEPLRADGADVMVVSGSTDRARLGDCLCLGARTVISKAAPLNVILGRLRCVVSGLPAMPREEREELIAIAAARRRRESDALHKLASLSPRERAVLAELMAGHPVEEIARRSFVSVATVRTQVKAIRRKLDVSSQLAAVGLARRAGWGSPTEHVPDLDDSPRWAG